MKNLLAVTSCLALIACGAPSPGKATDAPSGACPTTAKGTLAVTISGLPAGATGKVTVYQTGAGSQSVSATTMLSQPSGDYTVTADMVTQSDPIVRKVYKGVTATTGATLCDGKTSNVDVTYSLVPTSGMLWWGNENGGSATLGYASSQLAVTGGRAATVEAQTAGALPGEFDRDGNLWVIDGTTNTLKRYPAGSLAASGAKTPDVELSASAFMGGVPGPVSLTFDGKGNLFVGIAFSQTVVEFDRGSLAMTGTPTPVTTISGLPGSPNALAFDVANNLWVASSNARILKYASAHNPGSVTSAPDVTIEAMTPLPVINTLSDPLGLAFDASNNLWVDYDGTFARLTPSDQAGTGMKMLTPDVQIKADVLALPGGIAFDESGGLWFAYTQGMFAKFGASQLGASATVAPEVVITSASIGSATSPAFFPAPATSPLYSSFK